MKNTKFKELRRRFGYTQAALGEVFGITPDYVNTIENGRQMPGFALAKRIADFFEVTVDELFFLPTNRTKRSRKYRRLCGGEVFVCG